MDPLDRLLAVEEIRKLKARYFRYMDTKQFDRLEELFAPDMQVLTPSGAVYVDSGPGFAASLKHSLEHSVSVHQGFMGEIEILDEQNATGIWAMQDVIEWQDRHPTQGWKSIVGRGHYHETYRKIDGAWRIAKLTLTRVRLDTVEPR
jgi:SnoaL-like domain